MGHIANLTKIFGYLFFLDRSFLCSSDRNGSLL